jgi:hypothetical protein
VVEVGEEDYGAQKYGAIDRVYDGIKRATSGIPDGPLPFSDFLAGVYHGADALAAFKEDKIYESVPLEDQEAYTLGRKVTNNELLDSQYSWPPFWFLGVIVGAAGPAIAAAETKEPAFLLAYGTNITDGLNYVDRNHITGKYDSWEEIDEAVEGPYDEAKEAVSGGIEFLGNARDNIIRDTRSWIEHLGSDEYLDFQDPEIKEFWRAAHQLEKHGEITEIEYAYNSHPRELEVGEIEKEINLLTDEEHLRVTNGNFIIEELKGENRDSRKPGKTYNLRIDAEVDINDTDSEAEREPDWTDTEIFELSVSWPADYPDPRLFGSEEDEEESFREREPELARE